MKIYSVYDEEFKMYGRVIKHDYSDILEELSKKDCPSDHTIYCPEDKAFEKLEGYKNLRNEIFGCLDIQVGYCNGYNKKLNCLEYHMNSEINMANEDFILLLGLRQDIVNNTYDTSKVKAFKVPKGTAVEVYATSLHYAPVGDAFRVLVVLPKGTNVGEPRSKEEPLLWANNKWLLAHKDAPEARLGAYVGLIGENITLE